MPGKGLFQGGLAFTDAAVTARECTVPLGPDGRGALLPVPCTMKPLAAARRFRLTALCAHAPGEAPPGEAEAAALALDSVDVCTLPPLTRTLVPSRAPSQRFGAGAGGSLGCALTACAPACRSDDVLNILV